MKKIDFYFDFLSPFSYFAWKRRNLIAGELVYKPVLMGKLFSHFEFRGPGEIRVKRDAELKKCFRYAHKHQIPFHPPAQFPFNPLGIIRLATLAAAGEHQEEIISIIFHSVWAEGIVLEDPEVIEKILKESSLPIEIFESSFAKDSKLELKQNIKEALEFDIFGVPTFRAENENFWGNDSISDLNDLLGGNSDWNREYFNLLTKK